jgi:hypothetical protein
MKVETTDDVIRIEADLPVPPERAMRPQGAMPIVLATSPPEASHRVPMSRR